MSPASTTAFTASNALSSSAAPPSPTLASATSPSSVPVNTPPASVSNPAPATSTISAAVRIPLDPVTTPTSSTSSSCESVNTPTASVPDPASATSTISAAVHIPLDSATTPEPATIDPALVNTPSISATTPASATSPSDSASVHLPSDSVTAPATLKRKLSSTSIAESSTDSSSSSSSSATAGTNPKRICNHGDGLSTSSKFVDPWDLLEGAKWDHLGGTHYVHQIKWKRAQTDIVHIFDQDMVNKINQKATGVKVRLRNNNKVLKIAGPEQKVDHVLTFLQQLVQ